MVICIKVLGATRKRYAKIGDIIKVSVRSISSSVKSKIKKGHVAKALVIRTTYPINRSDGTIIRFDKNAVVLLDNDNKFLGTRVFGPVTKELLCNRVLSSINKDLRKDLFRKITSLASEVI